MRRSAGAVIGTLVGTAAYWLMLDRGIHILAAVGAGTALGVSFAAKSFSIIAGITTMLLAVASSLVMEFLFRPFAKDESFDYFLTHIADLPRNSLVSLAVVAVLGLYFGRGRARKPADSADAVNRG